jgi:hypothetical protein
MTLKQANSQRLNERPKAALFALFVNLLLFFFDTMAFCAPPFGFWSCSLLLRPLL